MRRITPDEWEIELLWRQTGPDQWLALLTDPRTGRRLEARSEAELQQALKRLGNGRRKPSPRSPKAV